LAGAANPRLLVAPAAGSDLAVIQSSDEQDVLRHPYTRTATQDCVAVLKII
jgi:hypothetical protein